MTYDWELLWRLRARADSGHRGTAFLLRLLNRLHLSSALARARNWLARNRFRRLVSWADVVVVNQSALDPEWRGILRQSARAVAYDLDDAAWMLGADRIEMIALSTVVVAGSGHLAAELGKRHANVVMIPTTVRLDRYERSNLPKEPENACVIGWVGSSSTAKYLAMLVEPLSHLGRTRRIILDVVGADEAQLPRFENVQLRVSPAVPYDPVDHVPRFDIGVMPMPDGEWERGKCAAKALEYMAAGIPAVCSAVGANQEVIQDGVTGYLVRSTDEWVAALDRLIASEPLRRSLGRAGRERVRQTYASDRAALLWDACLTNRRYLSSAPS